MIRNDIIKGRYFSFLDLALFRDQSPNIKQGKRCAIAVGAGISNQELERSITRGLRATFSNLNLKLAAKDWCRSVRRVDGS